MPPEQIRVTASTTAVHTGRRYQTRQKELVLACLKEHAGTWITARQVAQMLAERDAAVGTATIYRNLERLEVEGIIARGTVEGSNGTCYRYLPPEPERLQGFYLKCESCGRLMEIDCAELASFYEHFSREHHISIDPVKTVLYGTCPDCFADHGAEAHAAQTVGEHPGCSCPHCHPTPPDR